MDHSINLIYVLIKQVPNLKSKAGINKDGTVDRASAKAIMNPFDAYALEAALNLKQQTQAKVVALTMGPARAEDVLISALEFGADEGVLLSDRRLAGSDTLATAYALSKLIEALGKPDLVLCGLQTTDGDTSHVGPQIAERLDFPQITYVEKYSIQNKTITAQRVIEKGYQTVECNTPVLMTISNACHHLRRKSFKDTAKVKKILRNTSLKDNVIKSVDLDFCGADPIKCGLDGSPTIVAKTKKTAEKGARAEMFETHDSQQNITNLLSVLSSSERGEALMKFAKSYN